MRWKLAQVEAALGVEGDLSQLPSNSKESQLPGVSVMMDRALLGVSVTTDRALLALCAFL